MNCDVLYLYAPLPGRFFIYRYHHRLNRRFREHSCGSSCGRQIYKKYAPITIEAAWSSKDRSLASSLEYQIKRLRKQKKEMLINNPGLLGQILGDKIDSQEYVSIVYKF